MKRIGEYLLENKICDEILLDNALQEQAALKDKGIVKPLGAVLADSHAIAAVDIEKVVSLMHLDILASSSALFQKVSRETLANTLSMAKVSILPAGSVIIEQGAEVDNIFIVASGTVEIFTTMPDGEKNTMAHLKPGEMYGEISLLTGEPHPASARTVGPASLLVFSKKDFNDLIELHPEISLALIKGFASRLTQKDEEIFKANEKEKAYQQFVSQEGELSLPDLIGQTRTVNALRKKIHEAAENDLPSLIQGEPGTEKLVVAGTIHKNSNRASTPFLSMNAEDITLEGYGAIPDTDSDSLQLEMAQSSVLFGYEKGAFAFSQARGLGLLQICRIGTVVIENVDKLTKGVQQKLHDFLVHKTFETVGGQKPIASDARIIATTSRDLEELAEQGAFNADLLVLLQSNDLAIPPLKKRKSDLRLLVDFLIIMECFKTPDRKLIKGISPEAYQRIMEYDWPGNMDELQIVIRRAINLAQGEYLMPEDIFIGIAPPKGKYTINLLKFDKVRAFFKSRIYPGGLQIVTGSVFSLIFIMAFLGSRSPDYNVSVLLVWAMWWPMLTVSWFVGARIWCSLCPMGAVNDLLNRVGKNKLKVPAFIRDYGIHISAAGLAVIIWAEAASKMAYSPMATGFLLLSIASCAVLSGILFERRVWCRYLCPLGRLAAIFSGVSVIEWRSNSSICNSTCKNNFCFKGDGTTPGCPLYQGPFSLNSNQNCILCGNCVKTCPNESPAFNVRIPGHELWAALKPEKVTIIFVPVILGTQLFRGIEHASFVQALESSIHSTWLLYGLLLAGCIGISYGFMTAGGNLSFGQLKNGAAKKAELFTHAIIPLAFSFEFVYQLKPLLTRLGAFFPVLGRQFGFNLEWLSFTATPGIVKFWQVVFLLLGMALSYLFLIMLGRNHQAERASGSFWKQGNWVSLFFLGGLYIWIFMTG